MAILDYSFMPGMYQRNPMMQTMMQMRAMRYMNPNYGMARPGRMPAQRSPFFGGTQVDPEAMGYMQLSQTPEGRAGADQMFASMGMPGLHALNPAQASPYAVLPNSGFFGRHTRIGSALEGAMFGGANVQPAQTVGEGISNALRGALGGTAQRSAAIAQQYAAPFRAAQGYLPFLREQREEDYRKAQIDNMHAMMGYREEAQADRRDYQLGRLADAEQRTALMGQIATLRNQLGQAQLSERTAHDTATEDIASRRADSDARRAEAAYYRAQTASLGGSINRAKLEGQALNTMLGPQPDPKKDPQGAQNWAKNAISVLGGTKAEEAAPSQVDRIMGNPTLVNKWKIMLAMQTRQNPSAIKDADVRKYIVDSMGGGDATGSQAPPVDINSVIQQMIQGFQSEQKGRK